jgi:hypothetical protein
MTDQDDCNDQDATAFIKIRTIAVPWKSKAKNTEIKTA